MTTARASRRISAATMRSMLDERFGEAPLLTVYGGKITTYRRLAEDALARLSHFFPRSRPWTAQSPLPGGDFVYDGVETLIERTQRHLAFLDRRPCAPAGRRLWHAGRQRARHSDRARRSRHALWRRSHRRRGALPDEQRMGADRRGRAVAALQARLAADGGASSAGSTASWRRRRRRRQARPVVKILSIGLNANFIDLCQVAAGNMRRHGTSWNPQPIGLRDRSSGSKCSIVDDEPSMRKVCRALLQVIGIRNIHDAPDGRSGLEAICTHMPDLVLSGLGNAEPERAGIHARACARPAHFRFPTSRSSCSPATASVRASSKRCGLASMNICSSRYRRPR